jgi:hypothetical protein
MITETASLISGKATTAKSDRSFLFKTYVQDILKS